VPSPVATLWDIFRCTGRFTWPIVYIIITFCIWKIITLLPVKKSILILCVLVFIQWLDLGSWFIKRGKNFKASVKYQTELPSPEWAMLANDYKHMFFMDKNYFENPFNEKIQQKCYSFIELAVKHNLTMNDSYLARGTGQKINENTKRELEYIINNGPKDNTIYIFSDKDNIEQVLSKGKNIYFFLIDNVIIGIGSNKSYLKGYETMIRSK